MINIESLLRNKSTQQRFVFVALAFFEIRKVITLYARIGLSHGDAVSNL